MTTVPTDAPTTTPATPGRGPAYWVGLTFGLGVIAYGVVGLVSHSGATNAGAAAKWLVGADLLHDLVFVPVVGALGWLIVRLVPRSLRAPVRAALVGTALVVAIGWIPLRGYGRLRDNPSLAPLDYTTAVLTALGVLWGVCAVWALVGRLRRGPASRAARRV